MKETVTTNGLERGEFLDSMGNYCSIQIESEERNLWLGVDMEANSSKLVLSHMLLTHEQVKKLLPILQRFTNMGHLFEQNVRNRNRKGI